MHLFFTRIPRISMCFENGELTGKMTFQQYQILPIFSTRNDALAVKIKYIHFIARLHADIISTFCPLTQPPYEEGAAVIPI